MGFVLVGSLGFFEGFGTCWQALHSCRFDLLDYWFFKGTMDQVFLSDFGLLDGLTQEYGLVLLSDVGLVFTLRILDWFFHFGRWML